MAGTQRRSIDVVLIRLQRWLIVAALVLSIGGHWAFLQSIAWVGMAVSYSKDATLGQAIEKTFDGHHLCRLCKLVRAGQKAEHSHDLKIDLKKIDLMVGTPTLFFFESSSILPQMKLVRVSQRVEAPLLPPPLFA